MRAFPVHEVSRGESYSPRWTVTLRDDVGLPYIVLPLEPGSGGSFGVGRVEYDGGSYRLVAVLLEVGRDEL